MAVKELFPGSPGHQIGPVITTVFTTISYDPPLHQRRLARMKNAWQETGQARPAGFPLGLCPAAKAVEAVSAAMGRRSHKFASWQTIRPQKTFILPARVDFHRLCAAATHVPSTGKMKGLQADKGIRAFWRGGY